MLKCVPVLSPPDQVPFFTALDHLKHCLRHVRVIKGEPHRSLPTAWNTCIRSGGLLRVCLQQRENRIYIQQSSLIINSNLQKYSRY